MKKLPPEALGSVNKLHCTGRPKARRYSKDHQLEDFLIKQVDKYRIHNRQFGLKGHWVSQT